MTTVQPIRTITTAEAKITTVEVEVRTITIGKKQMTQSVFRQLDPGTLIDPETLTLNGTPWGRVNYWGTCSPNHLHIVWQHGNALRRDCVYPTWPELRRAKEDLASAGERCQIGANAVTLLRAYRSTEPASEEQLRVRFPFHTWTRKRENEDISAAWQKWDFLHDGNLAPFARSLVRRRWSDDVQVEYSVPPEEARPLVTKHLQESTKIQLRKQLEWLGDFNGGESNYNWTVPDSLTEQEIINACLTADATYHRLAERLTWAPQKWADTYALLAASDLLFIAV